MTALKAQWLRIAVHLGSLVPFGVMLWNLMNNQLTVDPIRGILLWTGKTALTLLILSLACTPLNMLGFKRALQVRRALGLYAFLYAAIHFLVFIGLDYGFDPTLLWGALFERPYAVVGFAAFVILIALAITSTRDWMKRLGKVWMRLHQWVYLAVVLVIVHFVWLVKADIREPLIYGAIAGALLVMRFPPIRHLIRRGRSRIEKISLTQT